MTGKVISLGQVIVDLTMNVDAVPRAGEDVFAGNVQTQVGASFNTLYAVRRMGVKASHAGVIGTGPWASQILQTLENQEIQHIGKRDAVHDSGFCVALTDANAERTGRRSVRQCRCVRFCESRKAGCRACERIHVGASHCGRAACFCEKND